MVDGVEILAFIASLKATGWRENLVPFPRVQMAPGSRTLVVVS